MNNSTMNSPNPWFDLATADGTVNDIRRSILMQEAWQQNARTGEILASALALTQRSAVPSVRLPDHFLGTGHEVMVAPGLGCTDMSPLTPQMPRHFSDPLEMTLVQTEQQSTSNAGETLFASALGRTNMKLAGPRRPPEILDSILLLAEQQSARVREILALTLDLSSTAALTTVRLRHMSDFLQRLLAQIDLQRERFVAILVSALTYTQDVSGCSPSIPRHFLTPLEEVLNKIKRQSVRTGEFLSIALGLTKSMMTATPISLDQIPDCLHEILRQAQQEVSDIGESLASAIGLVDMLQSDTFTSSNLQNPQFLFRARHHADLHLGGRIGRSLEPFSLATGAIIRSQYFGSNASPFETVHVLNVEEGEREIMRQLHERHRLLSKRINSTMIRKAPRRKVVRKGQQRDARDKNMQPKRKHDVDLVEEFSADECKSSNLKSVSESEPGEPSKVQPDIITCQSSNASSSPREERKPDKKRLKRN